MELWCKHLAVRLWVALILGGVASLVLLPPFAGAFGPEWMVIPGLCFLIVAYWSTGAGFAAMGNRRINRLMDEAKVWERAGMPREVREVLAKALNTLDSFLFSPPARKGPAKRLLAQTARFQMAQSVTDMPSDDVIEAYLFSFPHDREVAVKWLDGVLAGEAISRQTHDLVGRIREANEQDMLILQMAARFLIRERCCDLTALQTYHQLIDSNTPIPDELIHGMADLFLSQSRSDRLALNVYLDSYERGNQYRDLLQAIVASSLSIRPGPLTNSLLKQADLILAKVPSSQRLQMAEAFVADTDESSTVTSTGSVRPWRGRLILLSSIVPFLRNARYVLNRLAHRFVDGFSCLWRNVKTTAQSAQAKKIVKWTALGVSVAGVAFLVINTIVHLSTPPEGVKTAPEPVVDTVMDPFTIQVAAYLNEGDAKRYVQQLKQKEIDAYWTRASGGGKTWYQVRVSHFGTKAEAKTVGESLKTSGIIDDYYVANYQRP